MTAPFYLRPRDPIEDAVESVFSEDRFDAAVEDAFKEPLPPSPALAKATFGPPMAVPPPLVPDALSRRVAKGPPPPPITVANVQERMMAPPPSYRTPEQDVEVSQRRKQVEAMGGPEALGEFAKRAPAAYVMLATGGLPLLAEAAKPILEETPEEEQNPLVQGYAAAKAGPLPPAPRRSPKEQAAPSDIGSKIARAAEVLNPVPMIEQLGRATWDPAALGDVAGMLAGGKTFGLAKKAALNARQYSFSTEVMAPKDATAARAFQSADPYEVLGLNRKTATQADVDGSLRRAAKQWHPDLHPGDPRAAEVMARYGEMAQAVERDLKARGGPTVEEAPTAKPQEPIVTESPEQRARAATVDPIDAAVEEVFAEPPRGQAERRGPGAGGGAPRAP